MRKKKVHTKTKSYSLLKISIAFSIVLFLLILFCYKINSLFNTNDSLVYQKESLPHLNKFEVHGIDISKHNGALFWESISKHNINDWELKFVFIRATYGLADGTLKKDMLFDQNWNASSDNSLIKGAYHYYSPKVAINNQIDLFIKEVKLKNGDLPPVIDVENFEKSNVFISKKDIPKILNWLTSIEEYYKVTPIIYTSKKMYLDFFKNEKFSKYHFWIANYGEKINDIEGNEWTFWQHSEEGKIDNHKCNFDLNVFNGSEKELEELCIH